MSRNGKESIDGKAELIREILDACDSEQAVTSKEFWDQFSEKGWSQQQVKIVRDSLVHTLMLRNIGGRTNGAKYIITPHGQHFLNRMRSKA